MTITKETNNIAFALCIHATINKFSKSLHIIVIQTTGRRFGSKHYLTRYIHTGRIRQTSEIFRFVCAIKKWLQQGQAFFIAFQHTQEEEIIKC